MSALSQIATRARAPHVSAKTLRDEARLLALAGAILLAIGLPVALAFASMALTPHGLSPVLPIAAGGPPILLGYIACHYATQRLVRAKRLEQER